MMITSYYRSRCWYDCGRPIVGYAVVSNPKWLNNLVYGICSDCLQQTKDFKLVATTLEEAELYVMKGNL